MSTICVKPGDGDERSYRKRAGWPESCLTSACTTKEGAKIALLNGGCGFVPGADRFRIPKAQAAFMRYSAERDEGLGQGRSAIRVSEFRRQCWIPDQVAPSTAI